MLSIIIPVYNTEKYLSECVESILSQTFEDFEVILVDDGSTDNSWKICCEYQNKDKRVRAFHKENSGVSATRNFGLEHAEGEYISFCDSDDMIKPELYERLFSELYLHKADRVCGGYEYLYPDGHKLYRKPRKVDGYYEKDKLLSMMIDDGTMSGFLFSGVYNSIFKKHIIDQYHIRFDENIKYNEDSLFSFEYALHSNGIYSIQSVPLYLYRQHDASATKKRTVGDKYDLLRQRLQKLEFDKNKYNFTLQMSRRRVTECFWQILDIAKNEGGKQAIIDIKKELSNEMLIDNLQVIKVTELNRYKRIYFVMMKYKMARMICWSSKKVMPILSKYLSR